MFRKVVCTAVLAVVASVSVSLNAVAGPMFAMGRSGDNSTLLDVTVSPFSSTAIGTSTLGRFSGIDFDPVTGALYASSGFSGATNPDSLFTLDKTTGAATLVGAIGTSPGGVTDLAFDLSGTLFGTNRFELMSISTATGQATILNNSFGGFIESIAVDPTTNILYGLDFDDGDLYSIDKTTGVTTTLGSFGALSADITGFGIDSTGNFYASVGRGVGDIFALNIATFSASLVGDAFAGSVSDIAFEHSNVPEPSTLVLALVGIAAAAVASRKRRSA